MKSLLIGRNGLTSRIGNLIIVNAEDFASRCSKILKKGRKRNQYGDNVNQQKKCLTIDTVRRFAGLEAQVNTVLFPYSCS